MRHPDFARLIRSATVPVHPLAADELERAITEPARSVGATFEPGLVARITADVADQPGALPLLQYALTELYDQRVDHVMTSDAYDRLGGVTGALTSRAEEIYLRLEQVEQIEARRVFGRLVSLGEGTEDTRRRVRRAELSSSGPTGTTGRVLDAFGGARLLSFNRDGATREPTVEVAHEALIRDWPRLRSWIDEDRDSLRMLRHLTETAAGWDRGRRAEGDLYRGGRLEAAEEWAALHGGNLSSLESEFLSASSVRRDADAERDRRTNRRLQRLLAGVAVVAAIALVAGIVAFQQRSDARAAAVDAELAALVAEGSARVTDDPRLGLLLAAEAYRIDPGPASLAALQRVLTRTGDYLGTLGAGRSFRLVRWLVDPDAADPDAAKVVAAAGPDGVGLYGLDGTELAWLAEPVLDWLVAPGDGSVQTTVMADGAGPHLVFVPASDPTTLMLLSVDEPRPHPLIETETEIDAVALSSDGSDAFVLEASGQLTALDLESRSERWSSMAHPEISVDEFDYGEVVNVFSGESQGPVPAAAAALDRRPQRLAVSADGSRIVSAEHVSIRTWDTATGDLVGDQLSVVRTDEGARTLTPVDELAISRDGQRVAWAFRNTVAVAAVGAELAERGDAPATSGTSVGRPKIDGLWFVDTHLRVLFTDGRTALFDPDSQAVTDPTSTASPGRVGDVAIDPSGRRAVFAADQGVSVHALDGDRLLADAAPREATHHAGGVHPDLDLVILSSSNSINFDQGPGALWDVSDPVPRPLRYPDTERTEVVMHFSPDGRFLASMTNSFEYSIWDPATLERIATYPMPGSWISHDWSDDGRFFAAGTLAGLEIFHAVEGTSLRVLDALGPYPGSVGFDAGSGRLLGATSNGQAAGWSTDTWEPLDASALDGTRILAFSPNGRWLVTVDQDGSLFVRDPSDFSVERVLTANLAVSFQFVMSFVDDRYLVVFDEEGAELWNIESGVRVGDPFPNDPDFLAFRADSGPLLTAEGPWALLWNLDTAEWFDIACQAAGRNTGGSAGHVDRLGSQTAQEVVTRRAAALRK